MESILSVKRNKTSMLPIFTEEDINKKYADIYFYKITEELINELKDKKSLYQWGYPELLDNLSFFKNGKCWLKSISHERTCSIYCDDENEFRYLKSSGIKFFEKDYQHIINEDLSYDAFES